MLVLSFENCFGQSAESVLNSFKRLKISCNIGTSYQDYNEKLSEAIFQRKLFGDKISKSVVSTNNEAKDKIKNIKMNISLGEAELLYSFASEIWGFSFKAPGRDGILFIGNPAWKDFFMIVPSVHDKIYNDPRIFEMGGEKCLRLQYILSIIWSDAEAKLFSSETVYGSE